MKLSPDELLGAFKEMTLLELSDFVKQFEETFDVKAAAPVITEVTVPETPEPVEEQTEFTVTLEAVGDKKIQVIKEVRALTKLGLADSKHAVENLPLIVLEAVSSEVAHNAKAALERAGATVKLT